ncbi:MAG: 3'-5' exonuclease [Reinekea sp.]
MAEIIPSLSQAVLSRMTSGEKRLARRFESHLEDDYLCWFDIPIGNKRRYPDFILLHPARGMLFLEVKVWKIENIREITKTTVDLLTNNGLKTTANPLNQCRQYAYETLKLLERDSLLLQETHQHQGKLCFPYGWGVILSNITRNQWNNAINEEDQEYVLPAHLVICKDEMFESMDAEAFQQKLWNMFHYHFGKKLTKPQIDRIRWHLFPEIRINVTEQQTLLPMSENETETPVPDIIKVMDIQQEKLARNLGSGHRIVHGVAGSGKTLILGFRALHLCKATNKPILILCYNISLAAKLRSFINEKDVESKVQVYHFHDWCGELLKTYNVNLIESEKPHWERQVDSVILAVDNNQIPRAQYGAILIDEGHDFEEDWLRLIPQMIDEESNSLLLLYDDAQSIYRRSGGLGFSLSSVGIQAQGRTTILKLNYRNTQEILKFSYRFASQYLSPHGSDDDHIPLIEPTSVGNHGPAPELRILDNHKEEIAFIGRCIVKWQQSGTPLSDIAILYAHKQTGAELHHCLNTLNIPNLWMRSKQHKSAYDPTQNRVSILTLQSSKGLEFGTVVVAGMPKVHSSQRVEDLARLVYVGLTRAQEKLLVTSSDAEHIFTQKLAEVNTVNTN